MTRAEGGEINPMDLLAVQGKILWINPGPVEPYYGSYTVIWTEPYLPISDRETIEPVPASGCPTKCFFGSCGAPGSSMGCGGCCDCLRGCQIVWEQQQTAPLVWTGDSA